MVLAFWLVYPAMAGAVSPRWEGPSGIENLNLTAEQQQALQDLQVRFRQEIDQIRKKIMPLRLELRALSPEEFQGARGQEIRTAIRDLVVSGRERALFHQQEAWKLLREDQRGKLPPGSDLGFRCHFGGFMGRGAAGREMRRGPAPPPAGNEGLPSQP
jgi:hypothetical protein